LLCKLLFATHSAYKYSIFVCDAVVAISVLQCKKSGKIVITAAFIITGTAKITTVSGSREMCKTEALKNTG
jgi:hypothetical protein